MYETNLICLAEYYVFIGSVMSCFLNFVFLEVINLRPVIIMLLNISRAWFLIRNIIRPFEIDVMSSSVTENVI